MGWGGGEGGVWSNRLQPQDQHIPYLGLYGRRGVEPGGNVDAQGPTVPISGPVQGVGVSGVGGGNW